MRLTRTLLTALASLFTSAGLAQAQTATFLDTFAVPPPFGDMNPSLPQGICIDPTTGKVFVTDYQFTHSRVVRFAADGTPDLTFGGTGTGNSQLENPTGIAVNGSAGHVYVSDFSNNRLQVFDTGGGWISNSTTSGVAGGAYSVVYGVAVARTTGDIYVAEEGNTRIQHLNASGAYLAQWGIYGAGNGFFGFASPQGIAVNASTGQVYAVDPGNYRIQRFSATGGFETAWGSSGTGNGQFSHPAYVAVDAAGHVYVTDSTLNRVQRFSADGIFELAFGSTGSGDGQLSSPEGIAVSDSGIVYVADKNNGRIVRWQIVEPTPTPMVSISGKAKITTRSPKLALKGTATDAGGTLARVEVKVGRAAYKPAKGAASWTFTAKLQPGRNVILVRAVDVSGAMSATKQIVVVRK
jgi:DNA-binding beta-propeller fold protein YncE